MFLVFLFTIIYAKFVQSSFYILLIFSVFQCLPLFFSPVGELKYLSKIGLISPYLMEDIIKLRPLQQSNLPTSQTTAKETETYKTKEKENMDDEWDDFGDDEESGLNDQNHEKEKNQEGNEELFRLELEVQDFIEVLTGRFLELGTLSGLSKKLLNKNIGNTNNLLENQNRNSSESNKNEIENTNHILGVVAQSVASFLNRRHRQQSNTSSQSSLSNVALHTKFYNLINDGEKMQEKEIVGNSRGSVDILSAFEFIESPLQIMKRAGLDLISTGWGRYETILFLSMLYILLHNSVLYIMLHCIILDYIGLRYTTLD